MKDRASLLTMEDTEISLRRQAISVNLRALRGREKKSDRRWAFRNSCAFGWHFRLPVSSEPGAATGASLTRSLPLPVLNCRANGNLSFSRVELRESPCPP